MGMSQIQCPNVATRGTAQADEDAFPLKEVHPHHTPLASIFVKLWRVPATLVECFKHSFTRLIGDILVSFPIREWGA